MEPVTFRDVPAGAVVGVERRVRLESADWSSLWNNDYPPRMAEIESLGLPGPCCGYYFGTDEQGVVDFVMGKPARPGVVAPAGLVLRATPAARYAVFECGMAEIGMTWGAIYGQWLPSSGFVEDETAPCFEEFAPEAAEGKSPVTIYVPVRSPV